MANPPISTPFYMYNPNPNNPNMIVIDVSGYNAALGMGYTLTANPPMIVGIPQLDPSAAPTNASVDTGILNPTMGTGVIVDTSINPQQPDAYQPVPQG